MSEPTSPLSTRHLEALGSVEDLRRIAQAQAVLARLLSEWPSQHYRTLSGGLALGGYENGAGDDLLLLFGPEGSLIRCFDHESPMSPYDPEVALAHLSDDELEELSPEDEARLLDELRPYPGVLEQVPPALREQLVALNREPRRTVPIPSCLTFCIWRGPEDTAWRVGSEISFPEHEDPDGSAFLLRPYAGGAAAYQALAEEAAGVPVSLEFVERVYACEPLSAELLALGRPGLDPAALRPALDEIGYPWAL